MDSPTSPPPLPEPAIKPTEPQPPRELCDHELARAEMMAKMLIDAVQTRDPQILRETIAILAELPDGSLREGPGADAADLAMRSAIIPRLPDMTQLLLEAGFPPGYRSPNRHPPEAHDTPIAWAAYCGDEGSLRLLIQAGADPMSKIRARLSPLCLAAQFGHEGCARALLEAGALFGNKAFYGDRPASFAIINRKPACLVAMIEHGLALNDPLITPGGEKGGLPLGEAAQEDSLECARALLAAGADPNLRDPAGITPLMWASQALNAPMIQLLLEAHADPRITTRASVPGVWQRGLTQAGLDCAEIARHQKNAAAMDVAALLSSAGDALAIQEALGAAPTPPAPRKARRM